MRAHLFLYLFQVKGLNVGLVLYLLDHLVVLVVHVEDVLDLSAHRVLVHLLAATAVLLLLLSCNYVRKSAQIQLLRFP